MTPANERRARDVLRKITGTYDLNYMLSLNEVTPTVQTYEMPFVQNFLRKIRLGKGSRARYNIPEPEPMFKRRNVTGNVVSMRNGNPSKFRVLWGFIVFADVDKEFVRANAHCWLEYLRGPKKGQWLDPTPLVDKDEPDGRQLLITSRNLFTVEERKTILRSPESYNLGCLLSREMFNGQANTEKRKSYCPLEGCTQYVNKRASHVRPLNTRRCHARNSNLAGAKVIGIERRGDTIKISLPREGTTMLV